MPPVFESLLPVFMVMCLGWATRAGGFINSQHWQGFERVTYFILMPALIIHTIAMTDLGRVEIGRVALAMLLPILTMTVLLLVLRKPMQGYLSIEGPAFTSILQGTIRWNSFVGIALAAALYGKDGLAVVAVALAFVVPSVNFIAAYILSRYGSGETLNPAGLALQLAKNPFIWSTLVGGLIAITGVPIPKLLMTSADVTGRAALAAGLLLVGSGLELASLRNAGPALWIGVTLRLLLMPLLTGITATILGLTGAALAVPVLCAAVPSAAASYILARQNGGDAPLMASLLTMQTLGGIITIPLLLLLFSRS
jgi:malonate transporter and related proteins